MRRPATQSEPAPPKAAAPVMTRSRLPVWLMAVLLVLVTMALYWPATRCDFVNLDDSLNVTANVQVQSGLTLGKHKMGFLEPCGQRLAALNGVCPTWWTARCSV